MAHGSPCEDEPLRPKAYVIRLPGVFIGIDGHKERGSFQTVVMAPSEEMAWDVAIQHDVWERLPFKVSNVQIFLKDPVLTHGKHQAD